MNVVTRQASFSLSSLFLSLNNEMIKLFVLWNCDVVSLVGRDVLVVAQSSKTRFLCSCDSEDGNARTVKWLAEKEKVVMWYHGSRIEK